MRARRPRQGWWDRRGPWAGSRHSDPAPPASAELWGGHGRLVWEPEDRLVASVLEKAELGTELTLGVASGPCMSWAGVRPGQEGTAY